MSIELIVNADDLGYDPAIDQGILEAHAKGIVTAASAMVDTPFAARALAEAPASLDLGLHVVVPVNCGEAQLPAEIARQLALFRAYRGAAPSHLDSHRHAHAAPVALPAFAEAALREGLPLRALDAAMRSALQFTGVATADAFLGDAALRPCWTLERLLATLDVLPELSEQAAPQVAGPQRAGRRAVSERGACAAQPLTSSRPIIVELMCHPGRAPTHVRTSFAAEREVELAALCDPGVRAALAAAGVALRGFAAALPRRIGAS